MPKSISLLQPKSAFLSQWFEGLQPAAAAENRAAAEQPKRVDAAGEHRRRRDRGDRDSGQPTSPAQAITAPPAMTSPIVTGASPRRTAPCQGMSRNRSHQRNTTAAKAQGGANVTTALAIAVGRPPTFQPMKLIIMIMFGPGNRLHDREVIGEILIGQPAVAIDDKFAQVRQYARHTAKADRRQQRDMRHQRDGGGERCHRVAGLDRRAARMLAGTSSTMTSSNGSLSSARPAKASAANSSAAGRRAIRPQQPQAGGDDQPGGDGGDAAQDALHGGDIRVLQVEHAEGEAERPRDQDKPGHCGQRTGPTRNFSPTQTVTHTMFGPGRNWHRPTISANSRSSSQR